jgi:DNA-binding NarL/FixJ family response regulator
MKMPTDRYGSRQLTDRETQVIALVATGLKNAEVARSLGSTEQTVKNYLRGIYDKLGVFSRVELALWHARRGSEATEPATAVCGLCRSRFVVSQASTNVKAAS